MALNWGWKRPLWTCGLLQGGSNSQWIWVGRECWGDVADNGGASETALLLSLLSQSRVASPTLKHSGQLSKDRVSGYQCCQGRIWLVFKARQQDAKQKVLNVSNQFQLKKILAEYISMAQSFLQKLFLSSTSSRFSGRNARLRLMKRNTNWEKKQQICPLKTTSWQMLLRW